MDEDTINGILGINRERADELIDEVNKLAVKYPEPNEFLRNSCELINKVTNEKEAFYLGVVVGMTSDALAIAVGGEEAINIIGSQGLLILQMAQENEFDRMLRN